MVRFFSSVFAVMLTAAGIVSASTVSLKVDSGEVKIWSAKSAAWAAVVDTATIATGDSIATGDNGNALLTLAADAAVKMKGGTELGITIQDRGVTLTMIRGQIFLNKVQAEAFDMIMMLARDVKFVPLGTACALRIGKSGEPSVAVLRGRVRADLPNGQTFEVPSGQVGSYDPAGGTFKQNDLPPAAVASLEQWSGLTMEQPEVAAATPAPSDATAVEAAAPAPAPAAATPAAPAAETPAPAPIAATPAAPAAETPAPAPASEPAAQAEPAPAPQQAAGSPGESPEQKPKAEGEKGGKEKPTYELSAGVVTVNNEQWTRVAFGVDIPIWKFGVFLDLELFVNSQGKFSDKGWNFDKNNWSESVLRKIRYVRFGHENEPLFIKFGGLSNVTLGYGFIVDRFTNMLHYPDEKQLGLQFYLNDISPLGITLQTVVADFKDFSNDGGVLGARLGIKPFKPTEIPLLSGLLVSGTYATDLNQYAPARKWDFTLVGDPADRDEDGLTDSAFALQIIQDAQLTLTSAGRDSLIAKGQYDTLIEQKDQWASRKVDPFALAGADVGVPIIATDLLKLDLYGQAASRIDGVSGWGFGAPGVMLNVGPFWAQAEYRHIEGRFIPGYFGAYYLDERLIRNPVIKTKADQLIDQNLNGVFGNMGLNIANLLIISGTYQYLISSKEESRTFIVDSSGFAVPFTESKKAVSQRFEASAGLGDMIVKKIPKLTKLEGYFFKDNIGRAPQLNKNGTVKTSGSKVVYDKFYEKTPDLYFGYRLGFAITEGAALIWDARYGYQYDANSKLVPNNNVSIMTAITF